MKRNFARKSPVKGQKGAAQANVVEERTDSGNSQGQRDKSPFKGQKNSIAASQIPTAGDNNLNYQEKYDEI